MILEILEDDSYLLSASDSLTRAYVRRCTGNPRNKSGAITIAIRLEGVLIVAAVLHTLDTNSARPQQPVACYRIFLWRLPTTGTDGKHAEKQNAEVKNSHKCLHSGSKFKAEWMTVARKDGDSDYFFDSIRIDEFPGGLDGLAEIRVLNGGGDH